MPIPINSSLKNAIENVNRFKESSNLNLLFNKYIYNWDENQGYQSKNKHIFLKTISETFNSKNVSMNKSYEFFIKKWKDTINKMHNSVALTANNLTRLTVGLGNETILENSITLNNTWGFPYIPGSALKGAVRAYYINKISEDITELAPNDIDDLISLSDKDFANKNAEIKTNKSILSARRIFGTKDKEGAIIFFDAYPTKFPLLKVDIMNPHFLSYYSNKENNNPPPGDWENPVLIYFITVKENQQFLFAYSTRHNYNLDEVDLGQLKEYIKATLIEHGIGAKTSVGYGFFSKIAYIEKEAPKDPPKPQKKLSEIEQLAFDIENKYNDSDIGNFFIKLDQYSGDDLKTIAQALKKHFIKNKKWAGSKLSRKQKEKIAKINTILGEDNN